MSATVVVSSSPVIVTEAVTLTGVSSDGVIVGPAGSYVRVISGADPEGVSATADQFTVPTREAESAALCPQATI